MSQQVHRHVLDDGHIVRAEARSQASEVVMEDDIEHPVEPVLDAPVRADGAGARTALAKVLAPSWAEDRKERVSLWSRPLRSISERTHTIAAN
jgi:hypothetical protein